MPRPNSPHVNFIVSLDNAMRQGQTSYPFVVMQFDSENVTSVEVNLEEAELKEKGLEKQIEGKHFVTNLLSILAGRVKAALGAAGKTRKVVLWVSAVCPSC